VRVVLDTNVLVSGLMTPGGTCGRVVDLFVGGTFDLCVDDRLLGEYAEVLHRPELRTEPGDAAEVLSLLRSTGRLIPTAPLTIELPDPDDLPFLEVAAAADAMLVTGNMRHSPKKVRAGVVVMRPADLLEVVRGDGGRQAR